MSRLPARPRIALGLVAAIAGCVVLAGCSSSGPRTVGSAATGTATATAGATATGTITVAAAASLQQTFTVLGRRYDAAHPGAHVVFSFGGSRDLVTQIQAGAPADVFASADQATMTTLRRSGLLDGAAHPFATNVLEIATAPGDPRHVRTFADLASSAPHRSRAARPRAPCSPRPGSPCTPSARSSP
jgi:molybdate transport system substrate-binding protein